MEDKSRYVVVKTLCDIDENKAYSNIKLNQYFKKYDLNSMDRAFAAEILYGTIRWKLRIDYLIQKFSKLKLDKISPWVLNCIRAAVYQVFFMDKVPDFAAVNQSVEICKQKDKKASSFVNGILRNILRNKEEFNKIEVNDNIKKLSIKYSHPEWFVKKYLKEYGEEFITDLMEKNNTPSELSIRVNTLKTTKDELKKSLNKYDVEIKEGRVDECLILKGYSLIEKSNDFINGLFTIQDESSMLVARVLDPKEGEKIFDLCSAPGGKTTHIAQLMGNKGEITAFDIHEHKLTLVNDIAKRLGIDIIKTSLKDSTVFIDELKDYADRVLIDAPCSGLGLMRKKPEIRWNVTTQDIQQLKKIQYNIINNASKYVKVGGVIVYSTCTITAEENEDILKLFLKDNPNFVLDDICGLIPESFKTQTCSKGFVKLFPNTNDTDGFFISRLIRKW
jgi:16S rRNA (cytosine967-C5)-methyltransferase